jgi:phage shock protein B
MNDGTIAAIIVALIMAVPISAIYFDYRVKSRRLTAASVDSGTTNELWETARRMEQRIGYLEQVLDTEVPGWRSRGVQ